MSVCQIVTYVCPICHKKELRSEGGFVPETLSILSTPRCEECNSIMERYEFALIKSIWNRAVRNHR